ncbi:hypothetical protein BpHYR1_008000 [Brachionus plicatilis]|uniref:Uncharacterized protein n=1 Tax=Brachionus plicatilis TaxID=10195 RepID=A0A3M7R3S6_BRAPC|nr:hypothetical protein BpHYR1_008000 [Brachionus plicatilis]
MGSKQAKNSKEKSSELNFPSNFVNPYNNYYYPNMQYYNNPSYPQLQPNAVQAQPQFYPNYSIPTTTQFQNYKPPVQQIVPAKFQNQPRVMNQDLYPPKTSSIDGSFGLSCSSSTIPSISSQNSNKMPSGSYNYTSVHQ